VFEEAKKEFREYYLQEHSNLQAAEKGFRNLIVLLLKAGKFPEPKVSSRLKDRAECIKKFDRKYRAAAEDRGEGYRIKDYITDLIGIRIVCIYESDIEKVSEILKSQFSVVEETNKTAQIEDTDNSFGYKGLHFDLKLSPERQNLPEYSGFGDLRFEVQIRTIVQDAWSEVDHKLKYKKQTPKHLQRRVSRMAALFELADQEFEAIRDMTIRLEEEAKDKSKNVDEARAPLDLFGFIRIASDFFPDTPFGGDALDILLTDIERSKSDMTIADFREALSKIDHVQEYKDYLSHMGHSMTPYTMIRHALYRWKKVTFEKLLFDGHRKNFDRWLEHGTVHPSEIA
jgi:ppGpp synthetase/RelA/SpoT-type nucleotidyltranferase